MKGLMTYEIQTIGSGYAIFLRDIIYTVHVHTTCPDHYVHLERMLGR